MNIKKGVLRGKKTLGDAFFAYSPVPRIDMG